MNVQVGVHVTLQETVCVGEVVWVIETDRDGLHVGVQVCLSKDIVSVGVPLGVRETVHVKERLALCVKVRVAVDVVVGVEVSLGVCVYDCVWEGV